MLNLATLLLLLSTCLVSRFLQQCKCSAAMAQWYPTATALVTTHSQTTSSSACPASGRTPRQAQPFSSPPWTRPCWKSETCAIEAALQLPKRLMSAQEPASLINQGSKPYWESTTTQLLHSKLRFRLSSWDAFVCCLCNSVTFTTSLKVQL